VSHLDLPQSGNQGIKLDVRTLLVLLTTFAIAATPALAQFPPPGIYACTDAGGAKLGTISLLVAGDYQWDTPDGKSATGQVTSASSSIEAQSGPLADQHWKGDFGTTAGKTSFVFTTDAGKVVCQ
jgi:hypothetical protein